MDNFGSAVRYIADFNLMRKTNKLCGSWYCRRWWGDLSEHGRPKSVAASRFYSVRNAVELHRLPERNNLYWRRHQPQCDPLCGRNLG